MKLKESSFKLKHEKLSQIDLEVRQKCQMIDQEVERRKQKLWQGVMCHKNRVERLSNEYSSFQKLSTSKDQTIFHEQI